MQLERERTKQNRVIQIVAGSLFFLLGLMVTVYSRMSLDYHGEYTLGPGFMLFWIGIITMMLSIAVVVLSYRGSFDTKKEIIPIKEDRKIMLVFLGLCFVKIFLMKYMGMIISVFIFMLLAMKFVEKEDWKFSFFTAAVSTGAIWLVFDFMFKVNFPKGIFGF